MKNKIFWWMLMIFVLALINTSSIVWLVYNFTPSQQVPDVSLWDLSILKSQLQLQPNEFLSPSEKGCVYFFMLFGWITSVFFIKWLFLDTVQQARDKAKDKAQKAKDKDLKSFIKE